MNREQPPGAEPSAGDESKPEFHFNLGIVLKKQNRLEEAAASYQRAIALKPDYADAHNNLGNIWNALGKRDEARASFERALSHKPGKANSHLSLAKLCRDTGDSQAAVHHFRRYLECDPGDSQGAKADSHFNLGKLCRDSGESETAVDHFRRYLECDPGDFLGARMILAHMNQADTPERASEAQLVAIYKSRAEVWDANTGSYFAYALVAGAFNDHTTGAAPDVLDIGCGTGMVGAQVRARAGRLVGVDLSPAMLEKAREKQIYDRLEVGDIISFMSAHPGSYDGIVGAAILIHFGDLTPIFRPAHACLRAQGLFVFSVFSNGDDEREFSVNAHKKLAQSGCFRHSAGYIERLAKECGFSVVMLNKIIHERYPNSGEIPGLLAVLRRG
jgi:predicted TPR repeat methyltransferase